MSDETTIRGEAAVLTTIGDDGFPHHCFLSEDEWLESGAVLALSLSAGSRTMRNLELRPWATILRVESGEARLYRLTAGTSPTPMQADPRRASMRLTIASKTVLRTPPEERARLTGSLSFERIEDLEERGRRQRVKEELCP